LLTLFREDRLVFSDGTLETVELFGQGKCQVFASGVVGRTAEIVNDYYTGEYVVGEVPFTRESLALVTREEDVVFSKFVDAVVTAILYADEHGITQESYSLMRRIDLFRPLVSDTMFQNIIRAVGNYQEIWDRHTNPRGLVRGERNLRNTIPLGPMLITVHRWNRP
jgi:general L-amino acid transport system substrate-binding protein